MRLREGVGGCRDKIEGVEGDKMGIRWRNVDGRDYLLDVE